ncbi:MAG: TetR/AcrR family transcriptional regulator [Oleiphilus sp.]|nr:MAG: TetR/AcrR family transcriptional regulator [Oleiphilus sp.]
MAYRPTEKTEARKRAQHKLLSDTALNIVARGGFNALTVASLAEEAKVAIGTIYKYFKDKSAVCTHVFQRGSAREVETVEQCAFPEGVRPEDMADCRTRLEETIRVFSMRALAGHKLAYALIAEPIDPMVEAERLKYRQAYAEIFSRLVQEGVDKGEFRPQDSRVAATAIVGALAETLVGPLARVAEGQEDIGLEELVDSIKTFCLAAVLA